ncbi:hypothetical protein NR798_25780 [Archangium gephyra]|uniref:hypothetical protein n=1 Tax=Archangium gephyra TaxID=48 RepID=UPI0035D4CB4D
MTNPYKSILCLASAALLVAACGPAPEGEESEVAIPKKQSGSDSTTPEADGSGTVSQMSLVADLGSALGIPVATYPEICNLVNQWTTTCGAGPSKDVSYIWTVPATGSYRFSTVNSSFDTVLEIRNYNNTSQVLGCNNNAPNTRQSRVSLDNLTRGTRLLITIEAWDFNGCGSTHLNIARN